ncbi:uncharacterized protein LODBEIA_P27750 [Lodderomyces beijingensis]|uniref:EKC/KEOPS complex subunit GON7 n=1 Tax=Lodderomyces beijingensis TaxID=1775926 RepID=A0ABP0ZNS5_9ASCO
MSLIPTATYISDDSTEETLDFHPGEGPHHTNGKTTQISEIVINAGGEDRDKPSEHKDTSLGHLRASLTTLQDQINEFLTLRMKSGAAESKDEEELERRLLDEAGGEDDDDDEEEEEK